MVLLSGEPGIGKSRLIAALQERLAGEPHTRLRYFCSPHHQDSALAPDHRAARTRRRVRARRYAASASSTSWRRCWRRRRRRRRTWRCWPSCCRCRSATATRRSSLTPQRKRERDVRGAAPPARRPRRGSRPGADGLRGCALDRPELARAARPRRSSACRACRCCSRHFPPRVPAALDRPAARHDAWRSTASTGARARRWSQRVAGGEALPGEVVDEIVERTDGVPLFVEELTKAVLEAGDCGQTAMRSRARPASALAVPATLHASLMARLDRLGPAAKEVAQVGAVIGREFSYELLAAVARPGRGRVLQAALDQLVDAGLVFRRGGTAAGRLLLQARAGPGRGLRHAAAQQAPGAARAHRRRCSRSVSRRVRASPNSSRTTCARAGLTRSNVRSPTG